MLKAIIVDDAEGNRKTLTKLLREHCSQVEVAATADTVADAVEAIQRHQPDLLFMDIRLKNENGFDVLEQVGKINFEIIFTTAFDQYAIRAIKFAALDYLLKPINIDELVAAVQKARDKRNAQLPNNGVDLLMQNHKQPNGKLKKLALPTTTGFIFVEIQDIIRCEADSYFTTFYLKNGKKIFVSSTLKEYEELLSESDFFRVHQSHLINLNYISKYTRGDGGEVEMADSSVIPVARRKKEEFLKRLDLN